MVVRAEYASFGVEDLLVGLLGSTGFAARAVESGEVVLDAGDFIVVGAEVVLPDGEGLPQYGFSFGLAALAEQEGAEDGEVPGGAGGIRPVAPDAQVECPACLGLTYGVAMLGVVESGQVVEQAGELGVVGAEISFGEGQRTVVGAGGAGESPGVLEDDAETVQC